MLEQITSSVIDWGSNFGLVGLALVSFTESIIQPVPPDLLVIPMSLEAASTLELLAIFLVATISSVLGSLGGYGLDFMQEDRLLVDLPDLHYPGDWMRYWSDTGMRECSSQLYPQFLTNFLHGLQVQEGWISDHSYWLEYLAEAYGSAYRFYSLVCGGMNS